MRQTIKSHSVVYSTFSPLEGVGISCLCFHSVFSVSSSQYVLGVSSLSSLIHSSYFSCSGVRPPSRILTGACPPTEFNCLSEPSLVWSLYLIGSRIVRDFSLSVYFKQLSLSDILFFLSRLNSPSVSLSLRVPSPLDPKSEGLSQVPQRVFFAMAKVLSPPSSGLLEIGSES